MTGIDSVQPMRDYMSNKHKHTGYIHKGHSLVAASASIPSKYKTVVIKNNEKKGFNSGAKRFNSLQMNESPGPAKYDTTKDRPIESNASYSAKGLGGFASKAKRFPVRLNGDNFVGPGQYNPCITDTYDFNRANCTSNFHTPIAVTRNRSKKYPTPAPNQYNVTKNPRDRVKGTVEVAFQSRRIQSRDQKGTLGRKGAKRELVELKPRANVPAPGSYDTDDRLIRPNAPSTQAPFKSTTIRMLENNKGSLENPGPGTYHPYEELNCGDRKRIPRKHYLCISAPAIPLPPQPPTPGPGQYDLVDYMGPGKEYSSSSVFKSTTNRWTFKKSNNGPGPGTYNPQGPSKQSFIYNLDKKWI